MLFLKHLFQMVDVDAKSDWLFSHCLKQRGGIMTLRVATEQCCVYYQTKLIQLIIDSDTSAVARKEIEER